MARVDGRYAYSASTWSGVYYGKNFASRTVSPSPRVKNQPAKAYTCSYSGLAFSPRYLSMRLTLSLERNMSRVQVSSHTARTRSVCSCDSGVPFASRGRGPMRISCGVPHVTGSATLAAADLAVSSLGRKGASKVASRAKGTLGFIVADGWYYCSCSCSRRSCAATADAEALRPSSSSATETKKSRSFEAKDGW